MGMMNEADGPISLERHAADAASILASLGKPAVVVGQSMGAQVAELVAILEPDLVKGLALVTPVPLGGVKAPAENVAPFKLLGGDERAQREVRDKLSHDITDAALDRLWEYGSRISREAAAALVDEWNDGHPSGAMPSRFGGSALIARGESDAFSDESMIAAVAKRFAAARLATIPKAGHWPHVEQPGALATLLDDYLATVEWESAAV
jgi:pimeloyl-ACP methyl ester carboxylesterase